MKGSAMPQVTLTVNGKQHTVDVEARTLLVELLREKLGLTGTHVGCDTSQCGACVVLVDGISAGDLMIAGAIVILLIEMLKSARMSRRTIIDHLLSMILFVGMLVEFLLVKQVAST